MNCRFDRCLACWLWAYELSYTVCRHKLTAERLFNTIRKVLVMVGKTWARSTWSVVHVTKWLTWSLDILWQLTLAHSSTFSLGSTPPMAQSYWVRLQSPVTPNSNKRHCNLFQGSAEENEWM